jgi:hypothetical protein
MYDRLGVQASTAAMLAVREEAWREGTCYMASQAFAYNVEPETYKEAIQSEESKKWKEAMKEELDSLLENSTYTPMKLPKGAKPGGRGCIFSPRRVKRLKHFVPSRREPRGNRSAY